MLRSRHTRFWKIYLSANDEVPDFSPSSKVRLLHSLRHNVRMGFCEAPPLILFLQGDLAITSRSIPSLLAIPVYLLTCLVLCVRRRSLGWIDPLIVAGVVALQVAVLKTDLVTDGSAQGLPGYALLAPFMLFLAGYACWRVAGGRPLTGWPWPRFGLVATLSLLLADIGVALLTPAASGKVWQLGGACLTDALFIGPPFVMIVFYGLLDCRSSWVFCSQKCVRLGQCRFGMDGKGEAGQCRCGKDGPALTEQQVR